MSVLKPVPHPTTVSAPYWEGARQGKLMFQRCGNCGKIRHYPQTLCGACQSGKVEWIEASRKAKVHSWTVAHHAFHPAFKDELPYTTVIADMEEGVRVLGRYVGETPIRIDLPLTMEFVMDDQNTPVPTFRAVKG